MDHPPPLSQAAAPDTHLALPVTRNLKGFAPGISLDANKEKQGTIMSNISPTLALSSPTRDDEFQQVLSKIAPLDKERIAFPTKSEEVVLPGKQGNPRPLQQASDPSIHVSNFKDSSDISMPVSHIMPHPP